MEKQITNINICIANKKDAELIALLGRVTFKETFGHLFYDKQILLDYCNLTFSIDKIEKSITKPNNIFWIAYANRLPVEYAKLKLNSQSKFVTEKHISNYKKSLYFKTSYL